MPEWVHLVDPYQGEQWHAIVTPARLGYWVKLERGWMEVMGAWWRLTRTGAERCGRRQARRRTRADAREAAAWRVDP